MSSAGVLTVLFTVFCSACCTVFPPVSNSPPIPGQAVGTLDISGQRYYVQSDLQSGPPQSVIKDDGYFVQPSPELNTNDRWFEPENESYAGDFPTSTETFERLYSDGMPAIGPVATPPPDDNYIAQSSGTSKIFPDNIGNLGSGSGIIVLTKGPNDQYVPERWLPMQVPSSKVVEVVNSDVQSKTISGAITSGKGFPVKSSGGDISNNLQQVWIRVPGPISLQKAFQNAPTVVENVAPTKKVFDVQQSGIKSYQPQLVKGDPTLPPPPTVVTNKSPGFILPPPPPPQSIKSIDKTITGEAIVVTPTIPSPVGKGNLAYGKTQPIQQVKHIWVPTSQNTGKFISVPVGSPIDNRQQVISKGIPIDSNNPLSVSDTWVLRDDGSLPRFEQQKSLFPEQGIVKEKTIVEDAPVPLEFSKSTPVTGKTVDTVISTDIWPPKQDFVEGKTLIKTDSPQQVFPSGKSDSFVVEKSVQVPSPGPVPQKIYTYDQIAQPLSPQPSPILPPPTATIVKGKPPCPTLPQKSIFSPKIIPRQIYLPISGIKRQPVARVIRVNHPYGSYYVMNPRLRANSFAYSRPATIIKQVNNGIVRLIAAPQYPISYPRRQVRISVPVRQVALPISGKSVPRILYPPAPSTARIRYAFPWGSYLNSLPSFGRNILPTKISRQAETDSSSSSSSSESSESKSKSAPKRKEKKAKKKPAKARIAKLETEESKKSIESIEPIEPSAEPENEPVVEPEIPEPSASEVEPDKLETNDEAEVEAAVDELEAQESAAAESLEATENTEAAENMEAAESQLLQKVAPRSFLDSNNENLKNIGQPYRVNHGQNDLQKNFHDSSLGGRVVGRYSYRDQHGIVRNIAYISDANGYRTGILNDGSNSNHNNRNFKVTNYPAPDATTKTLLETVTEKPIQTNLAFDLLRD